jgi:predicted ATPase/class 3 adenylate cyclase
VLEFGILGPLLVRGEAGEIRVAGARRRALLVRLLVSADELIAAPRLAEDLWAGDPPSGAASTLQSHISSLRQVVGPGRLAGRDGGYVLEVGDDGIDVRRFESEARRGHDALAAGDPATASRLLETALGRWRGDALTDVSGAAWALPEEIRLEELRLGALESWLGARLELGEHHEVVALAEAAIADHPLRENVWGWLMLALYRSGRQADALRAYQRIRTLLGEELGIEPQAHLVALDDAIVQQKPELQWWGTSSDQVGGHRAAVSGRVAAGTGPPPPSGTVTLLFTDVENSTRLWEADSESMGTALIRHEEIVHSAVGDAGGYVFKTVGDAFCASFPTPQQAVGAAVAAQRALAAEDWPHETAIRVRMGLHSGVCQERNGDYFGPTVNRTARLAATASGGQIVVSGATAELLSDSLPDGVSLLPLGEHKLKDLSRPEDVFQIVGPGLAEAFPPLRSQTVSERRHNLPEQISSFVGREEQLQEICASIHANRLVTLTGTGGVGKTRLALQVALASLPETPDGVWLVELAPLPDSEAISRALAKVFAVREHTDRPILDGLIASLRDRHLLIVLDNCEHVLDPVARLTEQFLRSCPHVTVLTTSRQPLGLPGETLVPVAPLATPPPEVTGRDRIVTFEAVRLFVERVDSHSPSFTVDEANCAAVASICRRLDGLPLALELAATRVRSFSVTDVERRLDQRFRFLTGGSRSASDRQKTLRAAVDWSYDLLPDADRKVLCRLSVFVGSWELRAAAEVCGGGDLDAWTVEDAVGSLVDKSLVQLDLVEGVVRYHLLETIRSYADERLGAGAAGDVEAIRRAHAEFFGQSVAIAAPGLTGPEQGYWLRTLELDHDNLRAAMAQFVDDPQSTEVALRFATSMRWFWFTRGCYREGVEFLETILRRPGTADVPALKAAALMTIGTLHQPRGENDAARTCLEEALAIARWVGSLVTVADTLCELAWLAFREGDETGALDLADEAIALAAELGDVNILGFGLSIRGGVIYSRDRTRGRADIDEAVTCFQTTGDQKRLSSTLCRLAIHELEAGELDAAHVHLGAVRDIALDLDDEGILPFVNSGLGVCALLVSKDVDRARDFFGDALTAARRMDDRESVAYAVLGLAFCATATGDARAVRLHGAADALREAQGGILEEPELAIRANDHERLRGDLGPAAFDYGYGSGKHLRPAAAVALALEYARRDH